MIALINWIIKNWFNIITGIAIIIGVGIAIYDFFKLARAKQIRKIEEWMLWAVIKAEKELGGETGQVKLRMVYDMFVSRFPATSLTISFEVFSKLVDRALKKMISMLEENKALAEKVTGATTDVSSVDVSPVE